MPKERNTVTVRFQVAGPNLGSIVATAAAHLDSVDPDQEWRVEYDIEPEARTGAGEIISWRATVTATAR
jgi:hypothetical protein